MVEEDNMEAVSLSARLRRIATLLAFVVAVAIGPFVGPPHADADTDPDGVPMGTLQPQFATGAEGTYTASATDELDLDAPGARVAASQTSIRQDPVCMAVRDQTGQPADAGQCVEQDVIKLGKAQTLSDATVLPNSVTSLTAADGTTLGSALVAPSAGLRDYLIFTQTWSQSMHGLFYVWEEKHVGRVFWDTAGHVWSANQYRHREGYHFCNQGYGEGFAISNTSCSEEYRWDITAPSGHPISEWDRFQVSAIANGVPIWHSHKMHINAYPSGNITYY